MRAAVEAGTLDADRLASYHKLRHELQFVARKQDRRPADDERRKARAMARSLRRAEMT